MLRIKYSKIKIRFVQKKYFIIYLAAITAILSARTTTNTTRSTCWSAKRNISSCACNIICASFTCRNDRESTGFQVK